MIHYHLHFGRLKLSETNKDVQQHNFNYKKHITHIVHEENLPKH